MTDARARPTLRRSRFKKYCKARAARAPRSSVGPRHGQAAADTQCPRCDRGQHRACLRLRTCTARRSPGQASAARERQVFREEGVPVVPVMLDVDTPPDASSSQATWEDLEGVFRAPQMVGDRRVCVDAPHVLGFTCAAAAARRRPPPAAARLACSSSTDHHHYASAGTGRSCPPRPSRRGSPAASCASPAWTAARRCPPPGVSPSRTRRRRSTTATCSARSSSTRRRSGGSARSTSACTTCRRSARSERAANRPNGFCVIAVDVY